MPVMEISVVPVGTKTPLVSKYVAGALEVLKEESEIKYELTSIGTIVESDSIDKLFNLAKRMHQSVFNSQILRVVTTIYDAEHKEVRPLSAEDTLKRRSNK